MNGIGNHSWNATRSRRTKMKLIWSRVTLTKICTTIWKGKTMKMTSNSSRVWTMKQCGSSWRNTSMAKWSIWIYTSKRTGLISKWKMSKMVLLKECFLIKTKSKNKWPKKKMNIWGNMRQLWAINLGSIGIVKISVIEKLQI